MKQILRLIFVACFIYVPSSNAQIQKSYFDIGAHLGYNLSEQYNYDYLNINAFHGLLGGGYIA